MDTNQVNFWLSVNAANFSPEVLPSVKSKLEQMDDTQMMYLQSVSFKKPSTIFLIALLLGWERFFLDDIAMGVVKVITGYGCGIWWLIDIFSAKKRAQQYNFQQFQKATVMASGVSSVNTATKSAPTSTPVSGTIEDAKTQQQYVTAPVNENASTITAPAPVGYQYSQKPVKQMPPIVEKVKRILLSPKTEWEAIDKENAPVAQTLTSYLLLIAAVPAVISLLGNLFYSIFGAYSFGLSIGMGFKVAIMMYAVVVGGAFVTALVANSLAENFGSTKNFDKAFALAAYAWTPLCIAGILLIFSVSFLFWLWVIMGIGYGLFLLYKGIQPLMKTQLEQLTPYLAVCAAGFVVTFFLLLIALSSMFLGYIYFTLL